MTFIYAVIILWETHNNLLSRYTFERFMETLTNLVNILIKSNTNFVKIYIIKLYTITH